MRLALSLTAAGVLSTGLLLSGAGPAAAHDGLISTTPAAGSTIAEPPSRVTITFTGQLQTSDGGTLMTVVGSDGRNLAEGPAVVDGGTVTQQVKPAAVAGKFTVRWRVVGTDGHPISNTFTYTVKSVGTRTPTPTPAPTATLTATLAPDPTPSESWAVAADTSSTSEQPRDSGLILTVAVVGGAIILGAALVGVLLMGRDRRRRDAAAAAAAAAKEPAEAGQVDEG